jgi:hypothetical protein
MIVFISGEFRKNLASLSRQFAASMNRRFEFSQRRQFFVRMYNVTLPVVAIRISNEDSSPASIVTVDCETLLLCWGGRGFRDC